MSTHRFAFMKNFVYMWMHLYIKDTLKEITCLYVCLLYHNLRCKKLCLIHLYISGVLSSASLIVSVQEIKQTNAKIQFYPWQ